MPVNRTTKKKILFVCTGNTCRSVMAAALAQKIIKEKPFSGLNVEIYSAGLAVVPGDCASEGAVTVMREKGLDVSNHRSTMVTARDVEDADLVLAMTSRHREALCRMAPGCADKIHTLAQYAGAFDDIPDPFGQPVHVYRQVAAVLEELLKSCLGVKS